MQLGFAGLPQADLEFVVSQMPEDIHRLQGARILITGATGFVGRWLVASLAQIRSDLSLSDLGLVILARNPTSARQRLGAHLWREVEVIEADINVPWKLDQPVTHVFHGATPSSRRSGSADALGVLATSVIGTRNLIHAVSATGGCPRVVHLSSGAVYGPQPPTLERIPETFLGGPAPFAITAPYAEGKRAAEALLEEATRRDLIEVIQARLFAFLGPGLPTSDGFAIGNFMADVMRNRQISVHGDGTTVRSYLEARSLSAWLLLLALRAKTGMPYNVGSDRGQTLSEWARVCGSLRGNRIHFGDESIGDRPAYVPDVSNSRNMGLEIYQRESASALASWLAWLEETKSGGRR